VVADMPRPIQLHLDLAVDPAKEQQMLNYFETVFRPAATKFPGYIDLRMLKLRAAVVGSAPAGVNYRFALAYESEELRQQWVTSDVHATVWSEMERTFTSKDYNVLIFDVT
jgi:heme-degrading monooxygenase HmoA